MILSPAELARNILGHLEEAWNDGDGAAFAAPFTENADFVNIRGAYHQGKEAIAEGHRGIFQSIYKDSRIKYKLKQARALTDEVILVHSTGHLDAPSGPLAGEHEAIQCLVLVKGDEQWQIASFHNTIVAPQP